MRFALIPTTPLILHSLLRLIESGVQMLVETTLLLHRLSSLTEEAIDINFGGTLNPNTNSLNLRFCVSGSADLKLREI